MVMILEITKKEKGTCDLGPYTMNQRGLPVEKKAAVRVYYQMLPMYLLSKR